MTMGVTARVAALAVAAISGAGLAVQMWASTQAAGSVTRALAIVSQYFTILTNAAVAATMLAIGFGALFSARWQGGVLLAILVVGIVYHLLLAGITSPRGLALIADQLLHTAAPLAMLLWWLAFADRAALRWSDALLWLVWPLAYAAYALVRAEFSGFYPYPFLDLAKLGWGGLARSSAPLAVGFLALGLLLVGAGKLLPGSAQPPGH